MKRATPETWMTVLFMIGLIIIPVIVGLVAFAFYRKIRPWHEPSAEDSLTTIAVSHERGFLKSLLAGWLICGPVYVWLFAADVL